MHERIRHRESTSRARAPDPAESASESSPSQSWLTHLRSNDAITDAAAMSTNAKDLAIPPDSAGVSAAAPPSQVEPQVDSSRGTSAHDQYEGTTATEAEEDDKPGVGPGEHEDHSRPAEFHANGLADQTSYMCAY